MSHWHPLRVSGDGLRESGKHVAGGETLFVPGYRKAMFGIGVKRYTEALQVNESAMTENDTRGIRTRAGRPHRLRRPTPEPLGQSAFVAQIITSACPFARTCPWTNPVLLLAGMACSPSRAGVRHQPSVPHLRCSGVHARPASAKRCLRAASYDWQAGVFNAKATPKGFEPLRAKPHEFQAHLLNRSDAVSCDATLCNVHIHFSDTFHDGPCANQIGRLREHTWLRIPLGNPRSTIGMAQKLQHCSQPGRSACGRPWISSAKSAWHKASSIVATCVQSGSWALKKMRMPGIQPGSQAWQACMMPLHYMRLARFIRFLAH
jgi:hypothetical protein